MSLSVGNTFLLKLIVCALVFSAPSHAEDIVLNPGYWQYQQSTTIDGRTAPGQNLSGGECLLEEDSKLPVEHYVAKFQAGLGPDSNCTMSNQRHLPRQFSFDLHCQSDGDIQSHHEIEYRYSPSSVHISSQGTLGVAGRELVIQSDSQSVWVRKCTAEEKQFTEEYKSISEQPEFTVPLQKPLFTIDSNGAGPIKGSLFFKEDTIQALFPGFEVENTDTQTYRGLTNVFTVSREGDKTPIFQIDSRQDSDIAFSVFTNSQAVAGPQGERIGITKLQDIGGLRGLCRLGENSLSQTVVCLKGNFRSLYELPERVLRRYSPGDDILNGELDQALLSEMRYFLGYPETHARTQKKSAVEKIVRLDPDAFHSGLKRIDTRKPVVVHFTSNDGSCPPCEKNNVVFADFHKNHGGQYTFVEVVFNPWRSYLKKFKRLQGLPATELYLDHVPIYKAVGYRGDLPKLMTAAHEISNNILADNYDDVFIEQVDSTSLDQVVKEKSSSKLLLVNISSTDSECAACGKHNSFFRFAARQLSDKVVFSEMLYQPYQLVKSDAALAQYLAPQKIKVNGLPFTLIYRGGKPIGGRPGIWSTVYDDVGKFLQKN